MTNVAISHRLTAPYMRTVIACGMAALLFSVYRLPVAAIDIRFLLLIAATLLIGSRVTVKIPRLGSHISVSDTFVFLTLLLCGGEAAVLLASIESFCSSLRFARRKFTILLNTAVMALSTFLTVWVLRSLFGSLEDPLNGGYSPTFISFFCVMALVQYVVNSSVVAIGYALKTGKPIWKTWREHYLWTSITYFAGASAAAAITKLIGFIGFTAFIATTPIILIVYITYQTYLKNIESAERHVAELQESEERFRSAFDYAAIGMALVSPEGRWLQVNHSLCEIVGYSEEELLEMEGFQTITHPDDLGPHLAHVGQLLESKTADYQTEERYIHKDGQEVWVFLSVSKIRNARTASTRLIFQIQDITDRKQAEQQLLHDAFHDVLTGLPNRALFVDRLRQALGRSKRLGSHKFAVLFLDLDRFKLINDSLGHMVGDQLLIGIARRLETCLRPGDTVARLGGDEFTILLEEINDTSEALRVAQRVEKELSLPFNLGGHEVFTSVSIGIAPSETGYERPDDILRDADTAMYRAKSLGKARHEVFDRAMHAHAMNLLQLETDLRHALKRDEFLLHYQPIVSLETGAIHGFEALVRWQHPKHGFISPSEFIPIAEETGLILPIGQWVLREACRQMREWQEQMPAASSLSISVNLSGRQFTQPDLIERITQVLRETGLAPSSLRLEITETVVMENIETAAAMLKQLQALGVELSIDDFGTGYSSLSYLHRFPSSTLKIDRSFVSRMMDQSENVEIVRTIAVLAQNLDMNVVAEGVETEEQVIQLKALGCEYAQGFYFFRPMNASAITEVLANVHHHFLNSAPSEVLMQQPTTVAA
ncbi:MAG TPA: EAL domain-containing protein [Pyrinomonadaceae bacterium]|jgi:diguanylate cyclase (GGDEF)-like protein/PAS domain S-box-containing protein